MLSGYGHLAIVIYDWFLLFCHLQFLWRNVLRWCMLNIVNLWVLVCV